MEFKLKKYDYQCLIAFFRTMGKLVIGTQIGVEILPKAWEV